MRIFQQKWNDDLWSFIEHEAKTRGLTYAGVLKRLVMKDMIKKKFKVDKVKDQYETLQDVIDGKAKRW